MRRQSPSTVRSSASLRSVLSFAKTCSIGLRSGEYGGKNKRWAASIANGAADRAAFVRAEAIRDNDIAGAQRRSEPLFDISLETFAVDGTVEDARRIDASTAQGGHEGQGFPMESPRFSQKRKGSRTAQRSRPGIATGTGRSCRV